VIDWTGTEAGAHSMHAGRDRNGRGSLRRYAAPHPEFAEVHKRGAEGGRKSIRRMQFESATKASIAMQIWLGKQYLGQRDNLDSV